MAVLAPVAELPIAGPFQIDMPEHRGQDSTTMKPSVEVHTEEHALVAEFWECLRLDMAPVRELRSKYEAHVRSGGRPTLVVDLDGVGSAFSTALGQFVTLQKLVRQKGGRIIFCNVDLMVTEVFRISKLDSLFLFVENRPAALALAAQHDAAAAPNGPPPPSASLGAIPPEPGPGRDSGGDNLLRRHRRRML